MEIRMKMISLVPHEYAGVQLNKDDEFDAEERDVPILSALGRAMVCERQNYATRDLVAGMMPSRSRRSGAKAH
jgi:hypothetical protein